MIKKLYRRYRTYLIQKIEKCEIRKKLLAEYISIIRKRPLYKHIKWGDAQQKEFDEFWIKIYGKKISNRWHKLYESINGKYCKEYIPEILYSTKIEPKLNSYESCRIYSNKGLLETLYSKVVDGVRTPKTYLLKDKNNFFDSNREKISEKQAIRDIYNIGDAVLKPIIDSSSGQNVKMVHIHNGVDEKSGNTIEDIFKTYKNNFLFQERIVPHESLSRIYDKAINTIRFITYLSQDGIYNSPISLRVGCGGHEIDNIHAGGMVVGMSESGVLSKKAYQLGYGDKNIVFTAHPDTNLIFENYTIPHIDKIKQAAYKMHTRTPNIGIISWDFTINDKSEIIVIEANFWGQSVWFPQIVNESPFFGKNTEEIFKIVKQM